MVNETWALECLKPIAAGPCCFLDHLDSLQPCTKSKVIGSKTACELVSLVGAGTRKGSICGEAACYVQLENKSWLQLYTPCTTPQPTAMLTDDQHNLCTPGGKFMRGTKTWLHW